MRLLKNGRDLRDEVFAHIESQLTDAGEALEANPESTMRDTLSLDGILSRMGITGEREDRDNRVEVYKAINSLVEQGRIEVTERDEHLNAYYGISLVSTPSRDAERRIEQLVEEWAARCDARHDLHSPSSWAVDRGITYDHEDYDAFMKAARPLHEQRSRV